MATLESRVEKLERKINQLKAKNPSIGHVGNSDSTVAIQKQTTNGNKCYDTNRAAREKEASDIDNLVGDFGLL